MSYPRFVDISKWNTPNVNWQEYKKWSSQVDGKSRVCIRVGFGNGGNDENYKRYREGAEKVGIDLIIYYHYSYPKFNTALAEANWFTNTLGSIRACDALMLDFEEDDNSSTASWALAWLQRVQAHYNKLPCLYSYTDFIRRRLQDTRLTHYPLFLANWTFDPDILPKCPPPWNKYAVLQYSNKETTIPGIPGRVDADIYLGGWDMTTVPSGWRDDGKTLYSPPADGRPEIPVVMGFREYILSHVWQPDNLPLEKERHADHVDECNNSSPSGQVQLFRYSKLAWDNKNGVRPIATGSEEAFLLGQVSALLKQIAQLKAGLPITDIRAGLAVIGKTVDDISGMLP